VIDIKNRIRVIIDIPDYIFNEVFRVTNGHIGYISVMFSVINNYSNKISSGELSWDHILRGGKMRAALINFKSTPSYNQKFKDIILNLMENVYLNYNRKNLILEECFKEGRLATFFDEEGNIYCYLASPIQHSLCLYQYCTSTRGTNEYDNLYKFVFDCIRHFDPNLLRYSKSKGSDVFLKEHLFQNEFYRTSTMLTPNNYEISPEVGYALDRTSKKIC